MQSESTHETAEIWLIRALSFRLYHLRGGRKGDGHVLGDEQNIDGAQVEVIEVRHRRHAFSASVHSSIELCNQSVTKLRANSSTYHDCLAFVLQNMAGPTNLLAASQAREDELIRRIDWLVIFFDGGCHGGCFSFRSHHSVRATIKTQLRRRIGFVRFQDQPVLCDSG
jgi:hypothetical protein